MNRLYIYVPLLLLFIIGVSYYNTYMAKKVSEGFNGDNKKIILMGDSILKNNLYVENGKAVEDILREKNNAEIIVFAENNATITDIYKQLERVPETLNEKSNTVFLSVGGNNILSNFVNNDPDESQEHILSTMFKAYKRLVKTIQTKLDNVNLLLIDIYYPQNLQCTQYHPIIKEWNTLLYDYARENSLPVMKISTLLIEPSDFTLNIEPSDKGGEKIANQIIMYI